MIVWLAESDQAKNWYAGTLIRYPITSLISQARQTQNEEKCRTWCENNPGFHPISKEVEDSPPSPA